jgi:hypothetical protein
VVECLPSKGEAQNSNPSIAGWGSEKGLANKEIKAPKQIKSLSLTKGDTEGTIHDKGMQSAELN